MNRRLILTNNGENRRTPTDHWISRMRKICNEMKVNRFDSESIAHIQILPKKTNYWNNKKNKITKTKNNLKTHIHQRKFTDKSNNKKRKANRIHIGFSFEINKTHNRKIEWLFFLAFLFVVVWDKVLASTTLKFQLKRHGPFKIRGGKMNLRKIDK